MIKQKRIATLVLISIILLNLTSCSKENTEISKSGTFFDTVITITLYDESQNDVLQKLFSLAQKYDNYFSTTNPSSDIAKINSNAGSYVKVHPETIDIIKKSIKYSKLTEGNFDITIGRLSMLWKKAIESHSLPSEDEINEAKETVDYRKIEITNNAVRIAPNQELDLGGIAKGYIADKMKAYLEKENVHSALINLGGNILCLDPKPNGDQYKIGIKKPFTKTNESLDSMEISNKSVVTSGIYERYFKKDGKIYHHIIDLKTGYPCKNDLNSVTIISDSSTDGDALSTSLFLLGEKKAKKVVKKLDNIEVLFVHKDLSETKVGGKNASN